MSVKDNKVPVPGVSKNLAVIFGMMNIWIERRRSLVTAIWAFDLIALVLTCSNRELHLATSRRR